MPEKYTLRDRDGNEIGTATRVSSSGEKLAGSFLVLSWLLKNPGWILVLLIPVFLYLAIERINLMLYSNSVTQTASRIETLSLDGYYSTDWKTLVVDYQLINHASEVSNVQIGVQLPVEWYNCSSQNLDHTWVYGGSNAPGDMDPAKHWETLNPDSTQYGTIKLDSGHGQGFVYYMNTCQYKIGQPKLQILAVDD